MHDVNRADCPPCTGDCTQGRACASLSELPVVSPRIWVGLRWAVVLTAAAIVIAYASFHLVRGMVFLVLAEILQ